MVKRRTTPANLNSYLASRYYDPSKPGSLSGPEAFYQGLKKTARYKISRKQVRNFLLTQDNFVTHRRANYIVKPMRKIIASKVDQVWSTDLCLFTSPQFVSANEGYKYVLVIVDVLSKYADAAAIKTKSPIDVVKGFEEIFARGRIPKCLQSDRGTEYYGSVVKKMYEKYGIFHYSSHSSFKAANSEIFIGNFKSKLYKIFQQNSSFNFISHIRDVIDGINHSHNSALPKGMCPLDVTEDNEEEVFDYIFLSPKEYIRPITAALAKRKHSRPPFKYKVGSYCNISYLRKTFQRRYHSHFSNEIFRIYKRVYHQNIPTYYLEDLMNEPLEGAFAQNDLAPVLYDKDKYLHPIDRIVKKRFNKDTKQTEVLVHFYNWPDKFDLWLPEKQVVSYGHKIKVTQGNTSLKHK